MYFFILCLLCVSVYFISQRLRYAKLYKIPPNFPGWLPLIGHVHLFLGQRQEDLWSLSKDIFLESLKQGGVINVTLGSHNILVITDPDDAHTITNACQEKHYLYNIVQPWLGDGLLTADVPTWKKNRKILNQSFTHHALVGLHGVFNKQATELLKRFDTQIGKPFEPEHFLLKNNLETICQTAVGIDPKDHATLLNQYGASLRAIFDSMVERFIRFWLHSNLTFSISNLKKEQDIIIEGLHKLSNTVLQKRKIALLEADKDTTIIKDDLKPLIDPLLKLNMKNLMTDQEVRQELDTIIFGGHDTSAGTLTYALLLVGSHPDVQEKAYAEIMEVIGDSTRDLDNTDLTKLVYVDSILKETIRLYPIAPVIARNPQSDFKLKNYTIPAGYSFAICPWGIHRHSSWGPNPDQFKPERWLDTNINHKAFFGFGPTKRGCIGKTYSMMSMKIIMGFLIRRYKIRADIEKLRLKMDGLLRPLSGHDIIIELRKTSV